MGISPIESLRLVEAHTRERSSTRRQARIAKNGPSSWRKLWDDSLKKHYPECVVTYTDRASLHLQRMVRDRGLPLDDMLTFIPWVVENWHSLRANVFSLNPKRPYGPDAPNMDFFIRYIGQAHASYMRSKPEVAATLPLAARRIYAAPVSAIPLPAAPKKEPAASPAPINRPVIKPAPVNHAKAEAARLKLGLKKWI